MKEYEILNDGGYGGLENLAFPVKVWARTAFMGQLVEVPIDELVRVGGDEEVLLEEGGEGETSLPFWIESEIREVV